MVILNLANSDNSDITYNITSFPDGQHTIEIKDVSRVKYLSEPLILKSRMNSFKDVELIICATQSIRNLNRSLQIELFVPYFLGSRSDRKFTEGGVNYLKQVICPIINSQKFSKVSTIDPHSDVLEACLDNYEKISNEILVRWALTHIDNKNDAQERIMLVSPDAGALKKIYEIAKFFKISNVTNAVKVRDITTGNIVKTELETMNLNGVEHIVIIDDICDGGRTFVELAKEIRKQSDKPIYLIVTHGIFSAGFVELNLYFDKIFTTNSIKIFGDLSHDLNGRLVPTNVKQLNIF